MRLERDPKRDKKPSESNFKVEKPLMPKISDSTNTGPQERISRKFLFSDKDSSQVLGQHSIVEANRRRTMRRIPRKD